MANYNGDIIAWANEQARLLRAGQFDALDIEHFATRETGCWHEAFPESCPWSFDQIMNPEFWPD
jgi:hypothetical protein